MSKEALASGRFTIELYCVALVARNVSPEDRWC
jgi:hypothetical protein